MSYLINKHSHDFKDAKSPLCLTAHLQDNYFSAEAKDSQKELDKVGVHDVSLSA